MIVSQLRNLRPEPPSPVSIALAALLLGVYLAPFADLDFTWQIRTGEQIVRTGQLRTADEFSYTIHGQPVQDFEWLYEVVLYAVWSALGVGGLKLLEVVLIAAPLVIVGRHLHRHEVPPLGIGLALVAAILILSLIWNLRAYYCTTIGLLLAATWLHDHCTGRRPLDWRLPLVMLLWANLHPGVIAGQALLLGAMAWECVNRWLGRASKLESRLQPAFSSKPAKAGTPTKALDPPLERAALQRLLLWGGLGLVATFIAPDPLERITYPFRPELRHPIHQMFAEMQPLVSFLHAAPSVVLETYLLAALVTFSVVVRFRHYRLWEVALLAVLGLLANVAVRGLQDWVLVMLALGLPHLAACFAGKRFAVPTPRWLRFQPGWLAAAFAGLALVTVARPFSDMVPVASGCPSPAGAVEYIRQHDLHGRFFAPPNYGAYLSWTLGPQALVYVDTRGFFFPPELLLDSHALPQLGPDWPDRLERVLNNYETDFLLLETTGPRGQLWQLLQAKNVQPLYLDDQTVLLSAAQVQPLLMSQAAAP